MPGMPRVPGEAESPDEVIAGLRAICEGLRTANARLRELLAEKDEIIAALQVGAEVAAQEGRQAGPPEGAAGRDDGTGRSP